MDGIDAVFDRLLPLLFHGAFATETVTSPFNAIDRFRIDRCPHGLLQNVEIPRFLQTWVDPDTCDRTKVAALHHFESALYANPSTTTACRPPHCPPRCLQSSSASPQVPRPVQLLYRHRLPVPAYNPVRRARRARKGLHPTAIARNTSLLAPYDFIVTQLTTDSPQYQATFTEARMTLHTTQAFVHFAAQETPAH